jgi:hypothetical protein
MKKILLLGLTAIIGTGAYAQYAQKPVVSTEKQKISRPEGKVPSKVQHPTSKTRAASRWYDIVDAIDQDQGASGAVYNNDNYNLTWTDSTMIAPFGSSTAPTYDGIWIKSLQQVIDPADPFFNVPAYNGLAAIGKQNAYTIDSVELLGVYTRNPAKTTIVDTLIVAIAKGNGGTSDLDIWQFNGASTISTYGDTVRFASVDLNVSTFLPKGTAVWSTKIPLTAANANDTLSNGFNIWRLAPNVSVPSGNLAAMTVTFKSGDTWTPFLDTVSLAGAATPKFNNFRFVSFEETTGAFGSYRKGYYNSSGIMQQDTTGWGGTYTPSYAYTSATYSYEHHWWFWKLNCPACFGVGLNDVNLVGEVSAYPNPASDVINVAFTLNNAAKNVSVELSNALGQVVRSIDMGNGQADYGYRANIDVKGLTSGLYIYTIIADGQKTSNKIMVK